MPKLPNITIQDVLKTAQKSNPTVDLDFLTLTYEFADKAHMGQLRASGEPYIQHALHTARQLAELKLDTATIAAGFLHDVPEDCNVPLATIKKEFGPEVAIIVNGITKLGKLKYRGMERYVENLRKMMLAMADDVRVIFVKFCDRIHNLQTLDAVKPEKQKRIARESLEIFAVIANRLGMGELKGELEDLSFPYVYPKDYARAKALFDAKVRVKRPYIDRFITRIKPKLQGHISGPYEIHGRLKHLYTLWQKLKRSENDWNIDRIYDIIAVRIIVPTIADCYTVLGIIHQEWPPVPNRIKDYIAVPKGNGYQSFHTTVFAPEDQIVEIQIRTFQMHHDAEHGAAAHWTYKETGPNTTNRDTILIKNSQRLEWIQELLRWQRSARENPEVFLEKLKTDFFSDRIFVLTPRGDVIDLPMDATPLDFAYTIHSGLGHSCTGAMVNDSIVPLNTTLKSGDIVKIISDKKRTKPSADWLKIVVTHAARDHIRTALKRERRSLATRVATNDTPAALSSKNAPTHPHPKKRSSRNAR